MLKKFDIDDFVELDDTPMQDLVEKLRQRPGRWGEGGDSWKEIREMRDSEDDQ